jgi:hypothetical protein
VPEIALRDEILPLEDPRVRRNEAYLLNRPLCESFWPMLCRLSETGRKPPRHYLSL